MLNLKVWCKKSFIMKDIAIENMCKQMCRRWEVENGCRDTNHLDLYAERHANNLQWGVKENGA
jgi:hypothetical protein